MNALPGGPIAAHPTPLSADGELDLARVGDLVAFARGRGVDGLFVGGTSGEFQALRVDERRRLHAAVAAAAGDLPVILHVGHACLAEAVELARHARELEVAAVAAVGPFFLRPRDVDELVAALAPVAEAAAPLPFLYYHIPSHTGIPGPMHRVLSLARERIPTLAGAKHSDPDVADLGRCCRLAGGGLRLYFGHRAWLPALSVGACGSIGPVALYAPGELRAVADAVERGDLPAARRAQERLDDLADLIDAHGGPVRVSKALTRLEGLDCGPCRPPLVGLAGERLAALERAWRAWQMGEAVGAAARGG